MLSLQMLMHFHISSLLSVNEIIITEIALLMESLATYPANDKQTTELSSICVVYALKRWPLISQEALARLQVSVYISNELIMERAKRTLRLLCGDLYTAKLFSSSPQGYTVSFCSFSRLFKKSNFSISHFKSNLPHLVTLPLPATHSLNYFLNFNSPAFLLNQKCSAFQFSQLVPHSRSTLPHPHRWATKVTAAAAAMPIMHTPPAHLTVMRTNLYV